MDLVDEVRALAEERAVSRRALLGGLGIGAAAAAGLALPGYASSQVETVAQREPAPGPGGLTDADILTLALNLEYLEAEFYTYAVTGQGIEALGIGIDGTGTPGPTTGGRKASFSDPVLARVAEELAFDEQQHVKLLRQALGSAVIAKPALDLNALGLGFGSDAEYLTVGRAMEDTGITAYRGAAPLIRDKNLLGTAAGILADEAYHMGNVRLFIAQKGVRVQPVDAKDILPPPAGRKFFGVDDRALALARTPREVLDIVYGAPGASKGGFFPNGINGRIASMV